MSDKIVRDERGNIVSIRYDDGRGYDFEHDERGNVIRTRDTNGFGYDRTYDCHDNVLSHRRANGTGFDCTYDERGNILSHRRTNGTGYERTYDEQNNVLSHHDIADARCVHTEQLRAIALGLVQQWENRAYRKLMDAKEEESQNGRRLIMHGAMCYFNAASETRSAFGLPELTPAPRHYKEKVK